MHTGHKASETTEINACWAGKQNKTANMVGCSICASATAVSMQTNFMLVLARLVNGRSFLLVMAHRLVKFG